MFTNNSQNNDPLADFNDDINNIKRLLHALEESTAYFTPVQAYSRSYPLVVLARKIFLQPHLENDHSGNNQTDTAEPTFIPLPTTSAKLPCSLQYGPLIFVKPMFGKLKLRQYSELEETQPALTVNTILQVIFSVDASLAKARQVISTTVPFAINDPEDKLQDDEQLQFGIECNKEQQPPQTYNQDAVRKNIFKTTIDYQKKINHLRQCVHTLENETEKLKQQIDSNRKKQYGHEKELREVPLDPEETADDRTTNSMGVSNGTIQIMRIIVGLVGTNKRLSKEIQQKQEEQKTIRTTLDKVNKVTEHDNKPFLLAAKKERSEGEWYEITDTLNSIFIDSNTILTQLADEENALATLRNNLVVKLDHYREEIKNKKPPISPITFFNQPTQQAGEVDEPKLRKSPLTVPTKSGIALAFEAEKMKNTAPGAHYK